MLLATVLGLLFAASPGLSQTESQCLQSIDVKANKAVTYIAIDASKKNKIAINNMSCVDAERFRERLYVSMGKRLYESEQVINSKLNEAKSELNKLSNDVSALNDDSALKAKILGATVTVATVYAISTTAACASAVVDGVGIAACGPAARAAIAAVAAWTALQSHVGTAASLRSTTQVEIQKQQSVIAALSQQLDAAKAENMKDKYSLLFVGICRAVREQCL
jgi:hypothetical protein